MKIDIIISGDDINEAKLKGKIAVVIDMFRATSVIITALNNGCCKIMPFLTIEETMKASEEIGRSNCILGGERKAVKIDGFDVSNSPLEYTEALVKDKTVLMTTTNGTKTLTKSTAADEILIAAMINAKAIAKEIISLNKDVVIVNAGTNGNFSMDDYICSGYIINKILEEKQSVDLSDISKTAHMIYESHQDILSYVKNAEHYSIMKSLALDKDIEYCMQKDIIDIVPKYDGAEIRL